MKPCFPGLIPLIACLLQKEKLVRSPEFPGGGACIGSTLHMAPAQHFYTLLWLELDALPKVVKVLMSRTFECNLIWKHGFWSFNQVKMRSWVSLLVQWWRMCLPMQGTWVRSLVQEDATFQGKTKPVHLEPVLHNKRNHCNEKLVHLIYRVDATREILQAATKTQCSQK